MSETTEKKAESKFIATIKKAFAPEARKKTIGVILTFLILLSATSGVLYCLSPEFTAEMYVSSLLYQDITKQNYLLSYDYYSYLLGEKSEEEYFEEVSELYAEDIFSWKDLSSYKKELVKENFEDELGEYTTSFDATRTKSISLRKLNKEYEEELSKFEKYSFDRDSITEAKAVIVKVKIKGEDETHRESCSVILIKINNFWKVLTVDSFES